MKIRGSIIITLMCFLLVLASACGPTILKPSVGYLPEGWSLDDEEPYGEYTSHLGVIKYTNAAGDSGVTIIYGNVPEWLKGRETDEEALIEAAIDEAFLFEPEETGIMMVGGQLAGYAKGVFLGLPEIEIVFVEDTTYVNIFAGYVTTEDEADAMSLIDSIWF